MNKYVTQFYKNHALIYKIILFVITVIGIVYLFPKGGHFGFDIQKGKPWQSENLYAPFDFAIQKSEEELEKERKKTELNKEIYFSVSQDVIKKSKSGFLEKINRSLQDSIPDEAKRKKAVSFANNLLNNIYILGVLEPNNRSGATKKQIITLKNGNVAKQYVFDRFLEQDQVQSYVDRKIKGTPYKAYDAIISSVLADVVEPTIFYDDDFTKKALEADLNKISKTKGLVSENERIISRGDVVEGKKYEILLSLREEYKSQLWSKTNYNWIVFGYTILIALALLMLLLFIQRYRPDIFEDNTKITFIFFNILLMVFLTTMIVKYRIDFLYGVPLIILPIVIKAFFDARLGLFTHVLTVLLLGFVVPNSFEFIFLQIIAGIVTILTVSELYRRANLFISISKITLVYMVAYFAFSIIQEGNASKLNWNYFGLFALNGILSFLSLLLILIYERTFGLVSDVSLLELSNTNSKLLRELAEKAPGTFQHSMQVANLSEACANEIGANAMLVRTGALYHDIGKMANPMYFTENQTTGVNAHNELSPKDSAEIIIDHVINGIEIAKKNRLPDRIIDFIRTHHGTSLVYYFYKKQEEMSLEEVYAKDFQYPGPKPFSKETAILMMCDAAEASSKSLKTPTALMIDDLIDRVIDSQVKDNQFINADITFREIETIKKVIKKKLHNIYHLRVEYPE